MFNKPEMCRVCGVTFTRPVGVPRNLVHNCPGPKKLKIYTEEEIKEFEKKRKEEKTKPTKATKPPRHFIGRYWIARETGGYVE